MSNNAIFTQVRESLERAGVHDGRHGGDLPGQEQRVQVPHLYSIVQYSTVQYTCAVQVPHLPRRRLRPVRQVLRQADEAVLLAPRHLRLPPGAGMAHLCLLPARSYNFKI